MIALYPYGALAQDTKNVMILSKYQQLHDNQKEKDENINNKDEEEETNNSESKEKSNHHFQRPSFTDLLQHVQASEAEIVQALSTCNAIEIDGRWCSVSEVREYVLYVCIYSLWYIL